ncbi:MAG: hypothetical protein ACM31O_09495 [Bacteroidota bacterium]
MLDKHANAAKGQQGAGDARRQRLAAELRANLKKRKARARGLEQSGARPEGEEPES